MTRPGTKLKRLAACVGAILALALAGDKIVAAPQAARTGPFTAEQAKAGRAIYQATCASCHLSDMKGTFEAPALAGPNFMNMWRNRPTSGLFTRIHDTMPLTNPGSLSDTDAANLVAYILQANGGTAGAQTLTAETAVTIGTVTLENASPPEPPAAQEMSAAQASARPHRDRRSEELRARDGRDAAASRPADWLMVRGNYQAWNHSALAQINRETVKDLKLVWSWNMNDSARRE
jgi:mono/diheme cytochrome c family protein